MHKLEFFFDCSSPWTWFAFTGIQPLLARYQPEVHWRPILVGGVFNAVNQDLYAAREAMFSNERRMTHFMKDLNDWAAYYDLKIGWPEKHPLNAVKMMRGCFVAQEHGQLLPYAERMFRAYWSDLLNIADDDILRQLVEEIGMDSTAFIAGINDPDCKEKLRSNTQELIDRGGYGSPTIFIDESDMYFGNDRLPLIERALRNTRKGAQQ